MRKKILIGFAALLATGAVTAIATGQISSGVPSPNSASPGFHPNLIADDFELKLLARGNDRLENPAGTEVVAGQGKLFSTYGYLQDNATLTSRTRTEVDQNTYVHTTANPGGPTAGYDYGRNFLFQGHEFAAASRPNTAYFTRINLDVTDPAHRITFLNTPDGPGPTENQTDLNGIDGSSYNPFTDQLLYTAEFDVTPGDGLGEVGAYAQDLNWTGTTPPPVQDLAGSMGNGGYEGIHPDSEGNIYIVEDIGGSTVTDNGSTAHNVRQPASFVYRFVPDDRADLTDGVLQALQVESPSGTPITFGTSLADARDDALGAQNEALHSGATLDASWIDLHDTDVDGTAPFNATQDAKDSQATPLKRPENGKFVPGTDFKSFVVAETGDTNAIAGNYVSPVDNQTGAEGGAWGGLVRIDMPSVGSDDATVRTIALGDAIHNSFDNITFLDSETALVGEDRGNTLHQQLDALDNVWSFDITLDYDEVMGDGLRLVALGRDPEAAGSGVNETTGVIVSDGDTSVDGLLGAEDPADQTGVRIFMSQQHGQNTTFEIVPKGSAGGPPGPPGPPGPAGPPGPSGAPGAGGGVAGKKKCKKARKAARKAQKKCKKKK